jgi:hypothetical protein
MSNSGMAPDHHGHVLLQDSPLARFLFQSTIASWGWLILRVWVGLQFLQAGWGQVQRASLDGRLRLRHPGLLDQRPRYYCQWRTDR